MRRYALVSVLLLLGAGALGAQGIQGGGTASAAAGDIVGPATATDNAIARFDSTTGKLLQDSGCTITDAGALSCGSGTFNLSRWHQCFTLFDDAADLTATMDIPSIYAFTDDFGLLVDKIYCETNGTTETASINFQRDDGTPANLLSASLVCDPGGQTSCAAGCDVNTIAAAEDNFAVNDKLDLVMAAIDAGVRRVNVCVSGVKE